MNVNTHTHAHMYNAFTTHTHTWKNVNMIKQTFVRKNYLGNFVLWQNTIKVTYDENCYSYVIYISYTLHLIKQLENIQKFCKKFKRLLYENC